MISKHTLMELGGSIIAIISSFFLPIAAMGCGLFFVTVINHLTGIRKAKIEKKPITMEKSLKTGLKIYMYLLVILAARAFENQFTFDNFLPDNFKDIHYLTFPVCGYFFVLEFISIMNNFDIVTGYGLSKHMKERINKITNLLK